MRKTALLLALAALQAFGAAEWQFPNGASVPSGQLPGWLISDNLGMFGDFQKRSGMRIVAAGPLQNKEVLRDSQFNRGPSLAPRMKAPAIVVEFPAGAEVREIHLATEAASAAGEATVFTSPDGQDWTMVRAFPRPRNETYHCLKIELKQVRFLGIGNTGESRLKVTELLAWGDCRDVAPSGSSGILPEMNNCGERIRSLPVLAARMTSASFSTAKLSGYAKLSLYQFRKVEPEAEMCAYLAMNPEGLSLVFPHDHGGRRFQSLAILVNRNDLAAGQYYQFTLSTNGKVRTDASRVIDPTKGGIAFVAQAENVTDGDSRFSLVQIPLTAMVEDGRFEHYFWSFSLLATFQGRPGVKYTFPSIRNLHAPAQFALLKAEEATQQNVGCSWQGIDSTSFTQGQFDKWRASEAVRGKKLAVVSTAFESGAQSQPLLPLENLNEPRTEVMTKTEVENLCWFAVNPLDSVQELRVSFEGFQTADGKSAPGLTASLGCAGVVELRNGPCLRPIFMEGNLPGPVSLRKYIRNAPSIESFPVLRLQPGEAACVVLRVRSENAQAGVCTGSLHLGETVMSVAVRILDLTLARPTEIWNNGHAMPTILRAAPVVQSGYAANEAQYYHDCGINVLPVNPLESTRGLAEIRAKVPNLLYYFRPLGKYHSMLLKRQVTPETLTPEMEQDILKQMGNVRDRLLAAGFDYPCWFISLMDEPGVNETAWGYGKIAELIKNFDSRIQLYCNPCCWAAGGFSPAQEILEAYRPWYNRFVDISYPIAQLWFGWGQLETASLRELWAAPRRFNGTYIHPCPGRIQAWKAFFAEHNAWGFYSMFQPREDPWNDFDSGSMDYQSIYPGVSGPVFTVISEQTREAWEDYCMLTMLKESGKATAVLRKLQESLANPLLLDSTAELEQSVWRIRRTLLLKALGE
ncbi:MAG: hypothetical protein IJJ33_07740 [Victivallales bacterium]|nr:hypothetical protein [Victivallales bacterium]